MLFHRCIKPNDKNAKNLFNEHKIYNQLLYSGIIEGIKIVLSGYPVKIVTKNLIYDFRFIEHVFNKNIMEYIEDNGKNIIDYQVGRTDVFFKRPFFDKCKEQNNLAKTKIILKLQSSIKMMLIRNNYIKKMRMINIIESNC